MPRFAWRVARYPGLWGFVPGTAGVRAQAMRPNGRVVDDVHFVKGERILHVVKTPSPAATASLPIGERIVAEAAGMGG